MRFALEVVEAVRAVWPTHKPLFMRFSVEDDAGWDVEQSIRLAALVGAAGVDVVDCSSGGITGGPPKAARPGYGYQVPYARRLRHEAPIATMAVGLIVHADQAEAILQAGDADLADRRFRAAGDHYVGVAVLDQARGVTDGVGAGKCELPPPSCGG